MKLHCRNMHQVLGENLQQRIDALVCWTENGEITGGTASAINLCVELNIPVFNLGIPDQKAVLNDIAQFLYLRNPQAQ